MGKIWGGGGEEEGGGGGGGEEGVVCIAHSFVTDNKSV